ncbi:hypothetical protein D3C81_757960 [compost metagenome]
MQQLRERMRQHVRAGGRQYPPATTHIALIVIAVDDHVIGVECIVTIDLHVIDQRNVPHLLNFENTRPKFMHGIQRLWVDVRAAINGDKHSGKYRQGLELPPTVYSR